MWGLAYKIVFSKLRITTGVKMGDEEASKNISKKGQHNMGSGFGNI